MTESATTRPDALAPAPELRPINPAHHPMAQSLLMSSALQRLGVAAGLVLMLWLAVAWALSGTP